MPEHGRAVVEDVTGPVGRMRSFSFLAAIIAAGLLAGCETVPESDPAADPAPESGAAVDNTPQTAALPPEPEPEPEIDDDPERLIGLAPNDLRDLLGDPALVRRETPAQVWQYRAGSCVLDVVFYPETLGDRVTYVEARDPSGEDFDTRPCLNTFLRDRLKVGW